MEDIFSHIIKCDQPKSIKEYEQLSNDDFINTVFDMLTPDQVDIIMSDRNLVMLYYKAFGDRTKTVVLDDAFDHIYITYISKILNRKFSRIYLEMLTNLIHKYVPFNIRHRTNFKNVPYIVRKHFNILNNNLYHMLPHLTEEHIIEIFDIITYIQYNYITLYNDKNYKQLYDKFGETHVKIACLYVSNISMYKLFRPIFIDIFGMEPSNEMDMSDETKLFINNLQHTYLYVDSSEIQTRRRNIKYWEPLISYDDVINYFTLRNDYSLIKYLISTNNGICEFSTERILMTPELYRIINNNSFNKSDIYFNGNIELFKYMSPYDSTSCNICGKCHHMHDNIPRCICVTTM